MIEKIQNTCYLHGYRLDLIDCKSIFEADTRFTNCPETELWNIIKIYINN